MVGCLSGGSNSSPEPPGPRRVGTGSGVDSDAEAGRRDLTNDQRRPIWLNVGSSTGVLEGFVNFDNSPFLWLADVAPWLGKALPRKYGTVIDDFRDAKRQACLRRRDCRRPLPYKSGEVDHILCSHVLEYLPQPQMQNVLAEFYRVLRTAGTVHVILPDVSLMASRYVQGTIDADQFQRELMLHPEHGESLKVKLLELAGAFWLTHRWMYDFASATERLERAGFSVVDGQETPSSRFRADDRASLHLVGVKA
jgi:predicted SAM-dependent methyltransferase